VTVKGFSVVIPVFNESENIFSLIDEIKTCCKKEKYLYEIIIVNDSSTDNIIIEFENKKYDNNINLITNNKKSGQSKSIYNGVINSNYDIIVTLDGDGQNDPKDIKKLFNIYNLKIYKGLVGGIRHKRNDNLWRIISSKIANNIRSFILKDNCQDTGCGLKVFDKYIFLEIPFFDGMHRFLPALFLASGNKTFFEKVNHRARLHGKSQYDTFFRAIKGIRDILKVVKILKKIKQNNA